MLDGTNPRERENPDRPVSDLSGLRGFHPGHLADLAKSGLSAATIRELGIHTVPPRWIRKHLGFDNPGVESLLCFPYPGVDGFCRDKVFPPLKGENGHAARYLQCEGSGVHLYVPPLARAVLTDPSVTLFLIEGEKKIS